MLFAEINFAGLFTEKFLVAIGATTGSLAAFAIAASFWLVRNVVAGDASPAKIALVRWFIALCGVVLLVSASATVALALNNNRKAVAAETKAAAATGRERLAVQSAEKALAERSQLVADVAKLRDEVMSTEAKNFQLVAALDNLRTEPSLPAAAKRQLDTPALHRSTAELKAGAELRALLEKYEAPPR